MISNTLFRRRTTRYALAAVLGGLAIGTLPGLASAKALSPECLAVDRVAKSQATIYFGIGSTYLNGKDKAQLGQVAKNGKYVSKICVIGQADKQGNASANKELAEKRAKAIAKYLSMEGVSARNIEIGSRGESFNDALSDNYPRAQDRRVDVYFVPDGGK